MWYYIKKVREKNYVRIIIIFLTLPTKMWWQLSNYRNKGNNSKQANLIEEKLSKYFKNKTSKSHKNRLMNCFNQYFLQLQTNFICFNLNKIIASWYLLWMIFTQRQYFTKNYFRSSFCLKHMRCFLHEITFRSN